MTSLVCQTALFSWGPPYKGHPKAVRQLGCGKCGFKLGPSCPGMALLDLMRQTFLWEWEALNKELKVQYLVLGILAGFVRRLRGLLGCVADVATHIKMVTSGLQGKI